jgi:hypothetical protein
VSVMASRRSFGAILGMAAAFLPARTLAQFTEQEVRNGADIVATGDVNLSQSASGSQGVEIDGVLVTEDGIYQTNTGQVVVNDGRVVATGDVNVSQSASGNQSVTVVRYPVRDGDAAEVCDIGSVIANPHTGQLFYQREDCCWYLACANKCQTPCPDPDGECFGE